MSDSGVFRTSIFGGFNKNDVLKYFGDIKRSSIGELDELKVTNEELVAKIDELEADCRQKEDDIRTVIARLTEVEAENEKLRQYAEASNGVMAEYQALKAQIDAMSDKAKQDESYKSRCEQLMRAVVRTEAENTSIKSELEKLKNFASVFSSLDFDTLEREISVATDEKNKLEAELSKMRDTLGSLNVGINSAKAYDESMTKSLSSLINIVNLMKNTVTGEIAAREGTEI